MYKIKTTAVPSIRHRSVVAVAMACATLGFAGCQSAGIIQQTSDSHAVATAAVGKGFTTTSSLPNIAGAEVRGGEADTNRRATEQIASVVLRKSTQAWVSGTSVPMGSGQQLPSVFLDPLRLNFDDKPSLRTVAERLSTLSGVPIRIKSDVTLDPAQNSTRIVPVDTSVAAPIAIKETGINAVPMKWTGSLESYLNHITDLTGLSWEYRDGAVIIEKFRTEFFEVASFDGESAFSLGISTSDSGNSSSAGGGTSSNNTSTGSGDISDKGKSNPVDSILRTLKQIVKDVPGSDAIRSDGSGRIAVTTTKEAMTKVREFMRTENEALLRQVQIQFDIYSVRHSANDQRGVDWEAVVKSLGTAWGAAISSPATLTTAAVGTASFSILDSGTAAAGSSTARRFGNSKAILALLNEYGTSSEHRPVSLVSVNRQWGRSANLTSKAYVSATTPGLATSVGAGAPGLTTATVTTGDRYLAQAALLNNGTVLLKFSIGLSSLTGIPTFTSGSGTAQQSVQIPETTSVIDQAIVSLKAGQVLSITGLSRLVASDKRRTLTEGASIGLGGSSVITQEREDFVIFVRPTVL